MSYFCSFHFIALSGNLEFSISCTSPEDLELAKYKILFPFFHIIGEDKATMPLFQTNSQSIRDGVDAMVAEISSSNPKCFQIRTYFNNTIGDGELFYVNCLDEGLSIDLGTRAWIMEILRSPSDIQKANASYEQLCSIMKPFEDKFDLKIFCVDTKDSVGEKDKNKRVCRYCHKDSSHTTFKKIAHTISEALGNKRIITNDECDECNQLFGDTIETDFLRLVDFQRMFYNMRGKDGALKKFEGANYTIKREEGKSLTIQMMSDEDLHNCDIPQRIVLKVQNPFPAENVYKALCKYAFGVLSPELLPHFELLRKWLINKNEIQNLPLVAVRQMEEKIDHPHIMLFERIDHTLTIMPHVFCEVRVIDTAFVFILPMSDMDTTDFCVKENYDAYWNYLLLYNKVTGWVFKNFSGKKLIEEKVINIVQRQTE